MEFGQKPKLPPSPSFGARSQLTSSPASYSLIPVPASWIPHLQNVCVYLITCWITLLILGRSNLCADLFSNSAAGSLQQLSANRAGSSERPELLKTAAPPKACTRWKPPLQSSSAATLNQAKSKSPIHGGNSTLCLPSGTS